MTELATLRTSLGQCYDAIESLAGRMDAAQWHAQSLCPDWDMRGVIAHLGMMERVMTGWLPQSADDPLCALIVDWHYAGEFIRVGELDTASDVIDEGLQTLRPMTRERLDAAALTGAYELKAALVAARANDAATM